MAGLAQLAGGRRMIAVLTGPEFWVTGIFFCLLGVGLHIMWAGVKKVLREEDELREQEEAREAMQRAAKAARERRGRT